jgi:metacaspase-1
MKRALLIGINYHGMEGELRGCINDVDHIKDILINNCDYSNDNIRVLTDRSTAPGFTGVADTLPTHDNIKTEIIRLVQDLLPGDTLVFYFSGHGIHGPDTSFDEKDGQDEMLVPLDYKTHGLVSDDWIFANMIRRIPPTVTLWGFSDCCHSGTIFDLRYNLQSLCRRERVSPENKSNSYVSSEWSDEYKFYLERNHDTPGNVFLFSGCQDEEVSMDAHLRNKFQGAFSFCLIDILKNNMTRTTDGKIRFRRGQIKVRDLLKELNGRLKLVGFAKQNSQLSLSKMDLLDRTLDL